MRMHAHTHASCDIRQPDNMVIKPLFRRRCWTPSAGVRELKYRVMVVFAYNVNARESCCARLLGRVYTPTRSSGRTHSRSADAIQTTLTTIITAADAAAADAASLHECAHSRFSKRHMCACVCQCFDASTKRVAEPVYHNARMNFCRLLLCMSVYSSISEFSETHGSDWPSGRLSTGSLSNNNNTNNRRPLAQRFCSHMLAPSRH